MNYTIDLLNSWAQKLTYRIMKISGVSDAELQKYVKAVVDQKQQQITSDASLSSKVNFAEYIKIGLLLIGLFLVWKIVATFKKP
jgi:hypothetical protein